MDPLAESLARIKDLLSNTIGPGEDILIETPKLVVEVAKNLPGALMGVVDIKGVEVTLPPFNELNANIPTNEPITRQVSILFPYMAYNKNC